MSLATNYTFTDVGGVTSNDIAFERVSSGANRSVFDGPSPQGDLAGKFSLVVSHEEDKNQIVGTLVDIRMPVLVDGKYFTITAKAVVKRSAILDIDHTVSAIDMLGQFLQNGTIGTTSVADDIANMEV